MTAPVAMSLSSCPPDPRVRWTRCEHCQAPISSAGDACTGVARHRRHIGVQLYATLTASPDNLAAIHAASGRIIVGPDQLDRRAIPPLAWAVDNGAWGAYRAGVEFDAGKFRAALERWGAGADWAVVPDIVGGGLASLHLSESWLARVLDASRLALVAVQDGMTPADVRPLLGSRVGLFVGGTTVWKWTHLGAWAALARESSCHLHVGRVNSARRIDVCRSFGVDSIDGTSLSVFGRATGPRIASAVLSKGHTPMLPLGWTPPKSALDEEGGEE